MDKRNIFIIGMVVMTILMSSFFFYFYQVLYTPNFLVEQENRYLYIPTGATFEDVQRIVYDEKFVNEPISFGLLSKFMDYDELVKPGKYLIEKNSTNLTVIRKLRAGDQVPVRITFSTARTLEDVAEKLTANLEMSAAEFLKYITKPGIPGKYGFDQETFRCMFIPNTYEVYWTIKPDELTDRMSREYKKFWNEERKAKAAQIGLTPVEVCILASIVQGEVVHEDEAPQVAGLYINRLQRGMLLQADPTLIYAIGDFTINRVLNEDKQIDSPYNTYKYAGLPPGPINFPSITMVDAVLNYDKHKYIYMCAKDDFSGYHHFSTNLREHNTYARRYQRALNKARLYR